MLRSGRRQESWRRMWELFHRAVEAGPSERDALLEEACAGDQELRQEVARLLASHQTSAGLLDRPLLFEPDLQGEGSAAGSEPKESALGLQPGQVLAERFEIVRRIGLGGMGEVYAASDRELETTVALKILRPEIARRPDALDRFHAEINLARKVTHPNACRIFDLFRHGDDLVFLTMEFLVGETLADRIRREGPMGTDEALAIIEQVSGALTAAHEVGVVDASLGN